MSALSPAAMAKIESTVSDESGVASSPLDVKSTWQLGVNRSITKRSGRLPRGKGRMPSLPRHRRVHTPVLLVSPQVAWAVTRRQVNHSALWKTWLKTRGACGAFGSTARRTPMSRRASVRPRVRPPVSGPCGGRREGRSGQDVPPGPFGAGAAVRAVQQQSAGDGDGGQAGGGAQGADCGGAAGQQHHGDERAAEGAPPDHVRRRGDAPRGAGAGVPAAARGAVASTLAGGGERRRQPAAAVACGAGDVQWSGHACFNARRAPE